MISTPRPFQLGSCDWMDAIPIGPGTRMTSPDYCTISVDGFGRSSRMENDGLLHTKKVLRRARRDQNEKS